MSDGGQPPDGGAAAPRTVELDIAAIGRIDSVSSILATLLEVTGLGFGAIARVTETAWTACAVLDRIGFGLPVGGQLEVATTFCSEIRASGQAIVIDKASEDAIYRQHPTPKLYGFESYIAVPIVLRSGEVFGTICALDPKPARLSDPKTLKMLELFAELVASQLELNAQITSSDEALTDAISAGELREQFIAVLGHDLRNPIFALQGGVELLGKRIDDAKSKLILEQMRHSLDRMTNLVADILDFARGRLGGGIRIERRLGHGLDETIAQIVDEARSGYPDRRIEADIALQAPVFCDPERVGQLLSNLLANALTHGAADQPVKVAARGAAGELALSVWNSGEPIPAATLPRLFQPFTRSQPTPSQGGLGLGLYIASEVAKAHGGAISVTSNRRDGTCFTLHIPPPS